MNLLQNYKPLGNYNTRYFLLTGGRGSAKSWHVALYLVNLSYEPNHVILFTRYTLVSAHISIIPEFIEKIQLLNKEDDFDITKTEIINKHTGSRIIFRGIKTSSGNQTASLKSIQGVTTWVIDEAEELQDEDTFDTIDLSIRAKHTRNRVIMVMNPSHREHFIYKRWVAQKREDTTYIHTTYKDNIHNLSASFIEQAHRTRDANEARYNHLFNGEWIDSAEGLLWTRLIIDRLRINKQPQNLTRIVVAIDPAVTANPKSDETGIVVCGRDAAGNGYVLEDLSGKFTPNEWGLIATQAATRHKADAIVAEVNQGGDMIRNIIAQINPAIRIREVRATKGKYTRAEPIFNLYEQGKIYHVGNHPLLELQMCAFNPNEGASPDRVDALVWGFTELLVEGANYGSYAIR